MDQIASEDAVPYIIAEIPTNPRVEVPDLIKLRNVLSKIRQTAAGKTAIDPVFVLDQTFCPNKHFLGRDYYLSYGLQNQSYKYYELLQTENLIFRYSTVKVCSQLISLDNLGYNAQFLSFLTFC